MNIYVGNLSFEVTEADLHTTFSGFGEVVSVKVITDQYSGKSKGFGFVEMPNEQEAFEAIDKLNDTELDGSQIVVKVSVPRADNKGPGRNQELQDED